MAERTGATVLSIAFLVTSLLTFKDLTSSKDAANQVDAGSPKIQNNIPLGPTIKFLIWCVNVVKVKLFFPIIFSLALHQLILFWILEF